MYLYLNYKQDFNLAICTTLLHLLVLLYPFVGVCRYVLRIKTCYTIYCMSLCSACSVYAVCIYIHVFATSVQKFMVSVSSCV